MHSFEYKPKDENEPRINFNFNGDFSGDVHIRKGDEEIVIPATAILELVAYNYVLPKKVERLEKMEAEQILLKP